MTKQINRVTPEEDIGNTLAGLCFPTVLTNTKSMSEALNSQILRKITDINQKTKTPCGSAIQVKNSKVRSVNQFKSGDKNYVARHY